MSDNKIFSRSKSSELLQELEQIDKKSKNSAQRKKNVVKKVICNITIGNNEMINMFSEILKIHEQAGDDLELKRLTTFYFVTYATLKPELGSRLLDLLYRDLLDRNGNPTLVSLLLKTISSINLNFERVIPAIEKILREKNANELIKKTACFSIARIYEFDPKFAGEHDLLKTLNDQLYDHNISVVTTLLLALNDITERNPTLQLRISKDHAIKLLGSAQKCNEWSVVYILNSLMSFVPQSNEEALMIIDRVIPILQNENSSVVLNAIKIIIFNCNYVKNPEDARPKLSRRLEKALISLISKKPEIQFLVLRNIILLLLSRPNLIKFDIKVFFCQYDDPIYVKDTKLELIYLLADDESIDIVLTELEEYATDVDVLMSRKLVRAIGNLAVKLKSSCFKCVKLLDELISNGISYIVQEGAIVLKNILRKYQSVDFNRLITNLIKHVELIDEPESKNSVIWIIGNYCEIIPRLQVLLEEFGMDFKDESLDVQLVFLTSIVKYYLKFPKEGTDLVIKYLKIVTEEMNNPDLRERGYFYWRLISNTDINTASDLINSRLPVISSENEKLDQTILEELELNIGTLASIYLKPVNQIFRLAKPKAIPMSPALQPRPIATLDGLQLKQQQLLQTVEHHKKKKHSSSSGKKNFKPESVMTPATINNDRFDSMGNSDNTDSTQPLRDKGYDDYDDMGYSSESSMKNSSSSASASASASTTRGSNKKLSRKLSLSFKKMIN